MWLGQTLLIVYGYYLATMYCSVVVEGWLAWLLLVLVSPAFLVNLPPSMMGRL